MAQVLTVPTPPPPVSTRPAPPRGRRRRARETLTAYAFVAPSLFGVVAFLLLPVLIVAGLSLFDWKLLATPEFVGLVNYERLFADGGIGHSLLVTIAYVVLTIPVQTVLALVLALLLNQRVRGVKIFRALFVLPWMATPVVMGLVWGWIFDPANGAVNSFLEIFGIDGPSWLSSAGLALPSVAATQVWQFAGYNMLFFLAGLQSIPKDFYEAAMLDGASPVRQFFAITLPLLRPTLFFVLVTNVIGSFQVFDTVFVMTNGGPGTSTEVINYTIYQTAFRQFDFGYASAIAMVLFLIILAVTMAQVRYFNRTTTYDLT
ncbi:carbohydrate ABC transporter permease [Amycolatopsis coloradensis]|uniref:carbohydrate ABC transporter permease n=1 Tax=Amycolatopsis coloradensis TaxID=76021 RepID=UPI001FC96271|nr:sugar ABC transporter permease [Amycolatopsis coloradensis]